MNLHLRRPRVFGVFVPAFFAALAVSPSALACPSECGTCSSFGSYVSSLSFGVLIGVASIGVEKLFKRPKA